MPMITGLGSEQEKVMKIFKDNQNLKLIDLHDAMVLGKFHYSKHTQVRLILDSLVKRNKLFKQTKGTTDWYGRVI